MATYTLHTAAARPTIADHLSRILFTFAALLALLLADRPAPPLVIPPWSERTDDPEWQDAIRAMARRMAPHHRAR